MNRSRPATDRVIVVGSGPTGAIAAHTLLQRGIPVTLLDSGLRRAPGLVVRAAGNTVVRWTSTEGSRTGREASSTAPVEWLSSRIHGGLSCYWTGSVPRFSPDDFVDGARVHERFRWPISYDDIAEHYDEVDRLMGLTGGEPLASIPASVIRYSQSLSPDWRAVCQAVEAGDAGRSLGLMPMAKGSPWMVARRATEFNSYDALVEPLEGVADLVVLRGRHVMNLEQSGGASDIDTVVARNRETGLLERHRAVAVVLAAGALDTTEILLRSRSGAHPRGLGNGHEVLGSHLHDHPKQWWRMRLEREMRALAHPLYLTSGSMHDHPPMETAGFTLGLGRRHERLKTWVRGRSRSLGILTFATIPPSPDARVDLVGDECDPDRSDLRISMTFDERTHELLDTSRHDCVEALRAAGLSGVVDLETPHGAPGSSVHLAGGARMHQMAQYGVVDGENRLHDAPEVLVVDSACFTTGPEKNPTPTAMAIARRAASRLADRLTSNSNSSNSRPSTPPDGGPTPVVSAPQAV